MHPQTTAWLERVALRVVDAQLAEITRLDTKTRELLGFIGVVLGLLGAAAAGGGSVSGMAGAVFYTASALADVLLVWAGIRAVAQIIRPADYHDLDARTIASYRRDPAFPSSSVQEAQNEAFLFLADAAAANSRLLDKAHARLSSAYVAFAAGLGAAGLAILALIVSLV